MSESSLLLLILFRLMTANASIQKNFKTDKKVPLLRFADIISTHHVHSEMGCSLRCLNEVTCVGFKYKHGVNSPSVNCQLSNTTGENNMVDDDDQGWVYFVDIKTKLQTGVNEKISTIATLTTTQVTPTTLPQDKECFGYQWLNESNRNRNYSGSDLHCDNGLSGWYRFGGGAGIKMPTLCVPKERCGTHGSGWMDGGHPTVADGNVTRKVCFNWNDNCCFVSTNIEVVNCGQYYVYKLKKHAWCHSRYCGSDN